jgi:hypothetical protein
MVLKPGPRTVAPAMKTGAEDRLRERAVGMLDARHEQARATIARKAEILEQIATARQQAEAHRGTGFGHGQGTQRKFGERQSDPADRASDLENTLTAAERFVQGAQEHERLTEQRYTPRQFSDARAAAQRELDTPSERRDYEQLAYRLPGGRDAYQAASGQEKALMRERIDRQIADDQAAVDSAQHAADLVHTQRPVVPRQPRPRRPRAYRRYEFHGARQHMPPVRRERR